MSKILTEETIAIVSTSADCGPLTELPSDDSEGSTARGQNSKWWIASGIFLFVLASYILTSPGRIDIIDGQIRFDVAHNWLTLGRPIVRDPWVGNILGTTGKGGAVYSYYGASASVLSMPLLWLGLHFNAQDIPLSHFLFSLTSPILGALIAPILFLFYIELGISTRSAFLWAMVSSFATYLWPISNTTFDNPQHAFFAVSAAYLGYVSSKRDSKTLATVGGMMAGVLILYQEYFLLIMPALALSTLNWSSKRERLTGKEEQTGRASGWARLTSSISKEISALFALVRAAFRGPGEARSACIRYLCFVAGVTVGVILSFGYNDLRFGSFFDNGKMRALSSRHPVWGNPVAGLLTLLISPGKSLFLYSPPLVLGILGVRSLWRRKPEIALVILSASVALVLFMSCYAGLGGDFCWGPRYLTVLLPLWAVAFPFVSAEKLRRDVVLAIVGVGLLVQAMAVSVEPQKFFFERGLSDLFWAEDPWAYFKMSALFDRVGETLSLADGPPATARFFNSAPSTDWCTYSILGPPPPRSLSPVWMRQFKIYYLPRPWPLWMTWVKPALRPINMVPWIWSLLSMALAGLILICRGFGMGHRRAKTEIGALQRSLPQPL
jgi:hypothetical protein